MHAGAPACGRNLRWHDDVIPTRFPIIPVLPIILGFEKIPYYSKRNSGIMCVSLEGGGRRK
jgi:hypothetical protein